MSEPPLWPRRNPVLPALAAMLLMLAATANGHAQTIQPGDQVGPAADQAPAAPATPPATGQVTIESDRQQADNVTGIITATGNVRIVYPDRRVVATSRQAQYFTREGMIILSGDVDVIQDDGNLLRADRVTYMVEQERALAQPLEGQQVFSKLLIQTAPQVQPPGAQPQPITPPLR
ncbi:LPS-assembly protein LptD [Synechococcus sp. BA-124 BA4]|uniref:LPS-assembly protein LptD n=1 Tax=unclassified Synechococcus TaxID=2626047 RepID=UPI002AD23F49|nr:MULTISPECIES: LPS-assembly protein LptD [unclassified Synechococcus]MEA5399894.1 LPS-assembly protein LptD [Synechococcus sp. BA-124 BA4]